MYITVGMRMHENVVACGWMRVTVRCHALDLYPPHPAPTKPTKPTQPKHTTQRDSLPTADGGASGFGGGMPDLSSLAGMMGGAGGPGGLGGLMNNPGFMQMAQSMMQVKEEDACVCILG